MQIGWSPGARSRSNFHWVQNLLRKFSDEEVAKFNKNQCGAFAFVWNLLIHQLPAEVIADFRGFLDKELIPSMNPAWKNSTDRKGSYTLPVGDQVHTFHNVELAPPQGVMAENYSRYFLFFIFVSYNRTYSSSQRAMHSENQPHKYAAALTIVRKGEKEDGGHFFVGSYGVKVVSADNTLVVWQPKHIHGTSLQNRLPGDENPSFLQRGLAFVTSPRLPKIWARYMEQMHHQQQIHDKATKEAAEALWGPNSEIDEVF